MKLIRNTFVAGIAFAALTAAACSSQHGSTTGNSDPGPGSASDIGSTGSINMHWDVAPGDTLTAIHWVIAGPNSYSGDVTIGDAQSLEFVQGGILGGSGYTLTITGSDSNGGACSGTSLPFTVMSGLVSQVVLAVTCHDPNEASTTILATDSGNGAVAVGAMVTVIKADGGGTITCPGISSFSISPAEITLSQSAQLGLLTTSPATVAWSASPATGGTFSSPTDPNATFKCTGTAPQVTVTATVGLVGTNVCAGLPFTTMSALVTCEGQATDSGTLDTGVADTGTRDTGVADTGTIPDTGTDTGVAADAGFTCGVSCSGSAGGKCTPTECLFATHSASCYSCLLQQGCLDDVTFGDTGNECGDVTGNTLVAGETRTTACLNVVSCTLTNHAGGDGIDGGASSTPVLNYGYCGVQPTTTSCTQPTGQNGPCLTQETTGTESTDPNTVLSRYTAKQFGGGMGNSIFACAIANLATPGCNTCLQ